jgi:preprotein translocase subunit SecA
MPTYGKQKRLEGFATAVESEGSKLIELSSRQLRDAADGARARLTLAPPLSLPFATAFAIAREAAWRHHGQRHFPVQLMGGAALMRGWLAEMQTGEGKSLTALLPAITAALMGRAVHIVTVNDYLARRDAEKFAAVYTALGLTVGFIEQGQSTKERQLAYRCDVTYCSNKELVFDYLRDQLIRGSHRSRPQLLLSNALKPKDSGHFDGLRLRGLQFAIIDEADSVLIDEARTPLILSGRRDSAEDDDTAFVRALRVAEQLVRGDDFHLLPVARTVRLTDKGMLRIAELTSAFSGVWQARRAREEFIRNALTAKFVLHRDIHYIIVDGRIQIVDEFTGRVMPDRSWEHGIHQIIEVKEGCRPTELHQTLARITYQKFFRRYGHLCGMTGTATEAGGELLSSYGLRVVRIPTNKKGCQLNGGTKFFRSASLKWQAVAESVNQTLAGGRAVLIGTRSVEASENLAALLISAGLSPVVLNARNDRFEAEIIAAAGQPGRVTVATNMAGRGTDIVLHPAVKEAGGLHVILTEFHESTRVDRQLYGRAGRQGDPGSYEAIVALDDDLFQRFAHRKLLGVARHSAGRTAKMPGVLGRMILSICQSAATRSQVRERREALRRDMLLATLLGFAGRE